jgi:hypothetical protein
LFELINPAHALKEDYFKTTTRLVNGNELCTKYINSKNGAVWKAVEKVWIDAVCIVSDLRRSPPRYRSLMSFLINHSHAAPQNQERLWVAYIWR